MIRLKNVTKIFEHNESNIRALNNVNLHVKKGDIFGVIGLSGAGKSTLIRTVNFLEKPTSGQVFVAGKSLRELNIKQLREARKQIGMIFQHFNLLQSKTIYQNIALPLILNKEKKDVIKDRVMELLEFVGLADKFDRYPKELSGGQKQRVGIARALATNPSVLLCDEATSALDPQTTESILQLLKKINDQYNITILMITHEMDIIQKVCNRVAVMEEGKIVEFGPVEDVFSNPQHKTTINFIQTKGLRNRMVSNTPTHTEDSITKQTTRKVKVRFGEEINVFINQAIKHEGVTIHILHTTFEQDEIQFDLQISGSKSAVNRVIQLMARDNLLIEEVS